MGKVIRLNERRLQAKGWIGRKRSRVNSIGSSINLPAMQALARFPEPGRVCLIPALFVDAGKRRHKECRTRGAI